MQTYTIRYQAELIRDMIDMYREFNDNKDIVEYLSSFAFSIMRIIDDNNLSEKQLNWSILFDFLDQKYHELGKPEPVEIDEQKIDQLYNNAIQVILTSNK